nr:hypothetical protein [Tanacetum cinerariifolium]
AAQVAVFGGHAGHGQRHVGPRIDDGKIDGGRLLVLRLVGHKLAVAEVVAAAQQNRYCVGFQQCAHYFTQAMAVEALAHAVGPVLLVGGRAGGRAAPLIEAHEGKVGGAPVGEGFGEAGDVGRHGGGRS